MMQGPITTLSRERVVPRSDARLPTAWVRTGPDAPPVTGGTWLRTEAPRAAMDSELPVLALLGDQAAHTEAALAAAAEAGRRIYALVGPGWGKGRAAARAGRAPRLLVRRLPEVPATALHAGAEAQLWLGGGLALRLAADQAEDLRLLFLRLFWHEATEEAWTVDGQLRWRPAAARPFDVAEPAAGAALSLVPATTRLSSVGPDAIVHLASGEPPRSAPRRLCFPASAEHHGSLRRLAEAGTAITWQDRQLPDLCLSQGAGEALYPGVRGRLRVRLGADQARELSRLLEQDGAWRFALDLPIGRADLRDATFWLPGEAARGLAVEQRIPLPGLRSDSLRTVPETGPGTVPDPHPLSLSARYTWTVDPPRLPAGTQPDALLGRWAELDASWEARLQQVRGALDAAEQDRGKLGRSFDRLVGALLGFERKHRQLRTEAEALAAERPSRAGPDGARSLLARLAEVEAQAGQHRADLDEAERKAADEDERDRQRSQWQARVREAEAALPLRRTALAEAQARREAAERDLAALQASPEPKAKAARQDRAARGKKLADERAHADKALRRLQGEVKALERQAEEPFTFTPPSAPARPKARRGGRFVPEPASGGPAPAVPEEALPEVGALRRRGKERYLVIGRWEELPAGEQAAARLSATLVAPEAT